MVLAPLQVDPDDQHVLATFWAGWKAANRFSFALVRGAVKPAAAGGFGGVVADGGVAWAGFPRLASTRVGCQGLCICWDGRLVHYLDFSADGPGGKSLKEAALTHLVRAQRCQKVVFDLQAALRLLYEELGEVQLLGQLCVADVFAA